MKSPVVLAAILWTLAAPTLAQADPRQWLEGVEDPKVLAWVAGENARSTAALRSDPRYRRLHAQALEVASTDERIPTYDLQGPHLFSFWRNAEHVRGVWRRTTLRKYQAGLRQWDTVIDVDKLARAEKANWVWKAADCVARVI